MMSEEEMKAKTKAKKLREKERKEKEKRIKIMKEAPKYPINIWRGLEYERARLNYYNKKGMINKREEVVDIINLLLTFNTENLEQEVKYWKDIDIKEYFRK